MASATRSTRPATSFGRRWWLPILLGSGAGLLHVILAIDPLVGSLGDVLGGMLASLSGIGLGLLVAVFAALMVRLTAGPSNQPLQQHGKV